MESSNKRAQLENWKQEVLKYRVKDTERVINVCAKIETYAQEQKDFENLAFAYFYGGECYYARNEIDKLIEKMTKAVAYLSLSKQWELLARAQNLLAISMANKGNFSVALDYYLAGIKNCRDHNVTTIICSIHINLGFLYLQNNVYREAQRCFEEAYEIHEQSPDKEMQMARLAMIYTNLAVCYMLRDDLDKTGEYIAKIESECEPYFNNMDHVYVDCLKARYYHRVGENALRDACITDVDVRIDDEPMPLMDLYDDLESLCMLLLEIRRFDSFMKIIEKVEKVVEQSEIMDIERRLLSLKIEYYRIIGDEKGYIEATGWFYELVRAMDKESKSMISNMLYVRTSLERANESRKKIEAVNAILTQRSETDAMTGLANRYRLTDQFDKILEECRSGNKLLSVEILDVDYFKEYNDNYGHQAGDECIKAIASLLRKMEAEDENVFCARYGGDEFIVIYSGVEADEVRRRAKKLQQDVIDLQIRHAFSKAYPYVTISQGICQDTPIPGNKNWDFLHAADEMLYNVKRKTRNDICIGNSFNREADKKKC